MKKVHGVTKRGQIKITDNQVKMLADDVSKHDYENLMAYLSELIIVNNEHFSVKYHLVKKINSGEIYVSRPQMLNRDRYESVDIETWLNEHRLGGPDEV